MGMIALVVAVTVVLFDTHEFINRKRRTTSS
jgi:hypothetical protein